MTLKILEQGFCTVEKAVLCGCPLDGVHSLLKLLEIPYLISGAQRLFSLMPSPVSRTLIALLARYTVADKRHISDDIIQSVLRTNPAVAERIYHSISGRHSFDFARIKRNSSQFFVLRGEKDRIISRAISLKNIWCTEMPRFLITAGIILIIFGVLLQFAPWLLSWFGKLPGDIRIESGRTRVYFPIVTMIVISLIITLLINLLKR